MARARRRHARLRAHARGAVALGALAGYLAVLAASPAGQGLTLLPHLATAHAGQAPTLVDTPAPEARVLTTLRPPAAHAHDGHVHEGPETHEHGPEDAEHGQTLATPRPSETIRAGAEAAVDGLHRHGDVLHTHDAPTNEPAVVYTVALDQHQVPTAPAVPAPPVAGAHAPAGPAGAPPHVDRSVETPPPIRRG